MLPTTSRRHCLSDVARRFCDDFAHKESIETLLTHFSNTRQCEVVEHGLSRFAPFLSSPFRGDEGVRRYFSTVAALITYEDMHFSEYVIDAEVRKVSVKGTATFTWITTRESWDETFAYVLDFDDENKITRYQIWGDTGALYLASQGRLREVSGNDGASFHSLPWSRRLDMVQCQLLTCKDTEERHKKVVDALRFAYERQYAVDTPQVGALLKDESLFPTKVCIVE